MPVTLVISPELPITGWDIFAPVDGALSKEVMDALAEGIQIPPEYGAVDYRIGDDECYPNTPPPRFDQVFSRCTPDRESASRNAECESMRCRL